MSTVNGPTLQPDAESAKDEIDRETSNRRRNRPTPLRDWWNNLRRPQQWAFIAIIVVLAYLLPVLNPPILSTEPGTDWPIACFHMALYALIAVGLNVVVGYAGLLDLGYVAFFAVGGYVAAMLTSPDSPFIHIPFLWTVPVAMAVTMFFGVFLGVPTLRLRGDYLAIVTLGFGEIVRILATIIPALRGNVGFSQLSQPPGKNPDGTPFFSNSNGEPWYWLALTVIIIVLLLAGNLERSRVGRAWVAIREDEDAAEIMGVPVFKFKVWAFAIGAAIGGLSGALSAGQVGFINNQNFGVQTSILFLAAVVLGGAGNKVGAIVGGAIVAYLPDRFIAIADWKYLIFGLALIVMMIFRAGGILGARQKLLAFGRTAYARVPKPGAHPPTAPAQTVAAAEDGAKP
ncbi:MAG TPA: branched-chain amino acid ABC transporter permease [Galbitalea sp.]|jgi:branched-chain amino acid transport system permease protein